MPGRTAQLFLSLEEALAAEDLFKNTQSADFQIFAIIRRTQVQNEEVEMFIFFHPTYDPGEIVAILAGASACLVT